MLFVLDRDCMPAVNFPFSEKVHAEVCADGKRRALGEP